MTAAPRPWEQQPNESAKVFAPFAAYRDMGRSRSLRDLARMEHRSVQGLGRLSTIYKWVARAAAYDEHMVREGEERTREEERAARARLAEEANKRRADAIERQYDTATALLTIARRLMSPPKELRDQVKATGDASLLDAWVPNADNMRAATAAMDKAIHHQRLAMGLPTDVTRQDVVLRQQVIEAADVQDTVIRLIEEFVCDECKTVLLPHLRRVRDRVAALQSATVQQ